MTRVLWLPVTAILLAAGVVSGHSGDAPYAQVARVPYIVNGQQLQSFAYDPVDHRLYAGSVQGVFWVDVQEANPRIKGPLLRKRIDTIEVAPDAHRLFYTTLDEIGYVNLRGNDPPQVLATGRQWRTARLAYEPTRREMYLPTRDRGIVVYNTESGERGPSIILPGWYPTMLEAIPGKVFFSVADKSGLFVIDAATHEISPWPVKGDLITPAYLDADPTGQYLFATYERHLVAIDVASATIVGRRVTADGARIAYDPEQRLLIVSEHEEAGLPRIRLRAFSVGPGGLNEVAELKNPVDGQVGLESMRNGFLQAGTRSLLLWSTAANGRPGS